MNDDSSAPAFQPPHVTIQSVARNTALNYLGSVLALLNGIAISIIMARRLGPERLGIYSSVSFVVGLTVAIFSFGVGATIIKILSEYGARFEIGTISRTVRLFTLGVIGPAGGAAIAVAIALHVFDRHARYGPTLIVVAALSALPTYLAQAYRAVVNGFQEFGYLLRVNIVAAALLLLGVITVAVLAPSVSGFIVAGVIPNLVVATSIVVHYRRHLFDRHKSQPLPRQQVQEIVSYLWPVALISILDMIVWQYSEVLFLGAFRPAREVAFYTVAFSLASLLLRAVASSVTSGFMPALSQLHGLGEHERIRATFYTSLRFSLLLTLPLMAMIAVAARPLVLLFYGARYLEASLYTPVLVVAAGLGTIASIAADVMYSIRRQRQMLALSASVAVLNLGLDALLIPAHGVPGAVIANVVAQAVCAAGTLSLAFFRYGERLDTRAYLGPIVAASLVLAATWPVARCLEGIPALLAIGIVGVCVYLVGVRALHLLSLKDGRVLLSIAQHMPNLALRAVLARVLRFCAPELVTS